VVLRQFGEDMAKKYSCFHCCVVSVSGGLGRFIPMTVMVERGDDTGAFGLSQSYSQFHYVILCIS
jgi:hypothetical protein